jgi:hypothetical protein
MSTRLSNSVRSFVRAWPSGADMLGDRFEGSVGEASHAYRRSAFVGIEMSEVLERKNRLAPRTNFISCWHMSEHESEAMWKLYLRGFEGVAVRSTYARLSSSLAESKPLMYIGVVDYVDYDRFVIPEGCR